MKRIKIVDYYAEHTFHEVVNSSLIEICANIFSRVIYVSGKTAQSNMKRLISSKRNLLKNIDFQTMIAYEANTSWGARIRDIWGIFTTIYQYIITSYQTLILYNYTNKLSLPIILLLNVFLRKKVIFLFHGELEFLIGNVSYLKTSGWYKKCMQISFLYLFSKSPAYILVLGDSIRTNLLRIYPKLDNAILSIYHPYFIDNEKHEIKKREKQLLRIGTVGIMNKLKGLEELMALSNRLKDLLLDKKLELYCIGKVNATDVQLADEIHWVGYKSGLSREDFERQIEMLDYILYLYPTNSYRFTASGAIMDAVKMHKPIISLHNDYFDQLMDNYPIGYMGNTIDDLENIIRRLVAGELNDDFSEAMALLSKKVSIGNNTILFESELRRLNLLN